MVNEKTEITEAEDLFVQAKLNRDSTLHRIRDLKKQLGCLNKTLQDQDRYLEECRITWVNTKD